MATLARRFGLFYLTHAVTFFFLCAYALAASAPHYPYLPPLFFPIYLAAAVALSERETGDPMLGILPISPREIVGAKLGLAFAFVVTGWLNMCAFTLLQNLPAHLATDVYKLSALCSAGTLLLALAFQFGIHFFGLRAFHKLIMGFAALSAVFGGLFFVTLAKRGHRHPEVFPLVPFLESVPWLVVALAAFAGVALFYVGLRTGPWNPQRELPPAAPPHALPG